MAPDVALIDGPRSKRLAAYAPTQRASVARLGAPDDSAYDHGRSGVTAAVGQLPASRTASTRPQPSFGLLG